jgi:Sulfotransferase family
MADYSFGSKLLHYMALNSRTMRRVAFDMDCMMARFQKAPEKIAPPVFISGLARAGTTILLEALYSTGVFTTLTYRHMPFVMAPVSWNSITSGLQKNTELKERAHGDRLYVNFDSPEAFEEVFWLSFADDPYVKKDRLEPHGFDSEVIDNYQKFVKNIVTSCGGNESTRYLAKNNNNLLRIQSLKKAFPESVIVVPFRNPYDQAKSLQRQHEKFLKVHTEDSFSLRYMNWLGHFEFGMNFKPFNVCDDVLPESREQLNEIGYWLDYWRAVYQFVMEQYGDHVVFLDYDRFCLEPEMSLEKLARSISLDPSLLVPFRDKIKNAVQYDRDTTNTPESVNKVYEELQKISLQSR